jgi:hypothetical protein
MAPKKAVERVLLKLVSGQSFLFDQTGRSAGPGGYAVVRVDLIKKSAYFLSNRFRGIE